MTVQDSPKDEWIIYCSDCLEETLAEKIELDFKCSKCNRLWNPEDCQPYNPAIVDYYFQQFKGGGLKD